MSSETSATSATSTTSTTFNADSYRKSHFPLVEWDPLRFHPPVPSERPATVPHRCSDEHADSLRERAKLAASIPLSSSVTSTISTASSLSSSRSLRSKRSFAGHEFSRRPHTPPDDHPAVPFVHYRGSQHEIHEGFDFGFSGKGAADVVVTAAELGKKRRVISATPSIPTPTPTTRVMTNVTPTPATVIKGGPTNLFFAHLDDDTGDLMAGSAAVSRAQNSEPSWPSPVSSESSADWSAPELVGSNGDVVNNRSFWEDDSDDDDDDDDFSAADVTNGGEVFTTSLSPRPRPAPRAVNAAEAFIKRGGWKRRGIVFGGNDAGDADEEQDASEEEQAF